MKIRLVFTGKTNFPYLESGISDYTLRIKKYLPFEILNKYLKNQYNSK